MSRKVHGNKYDYSNLKYGKNNLDKVSIICPIHGEFRQSPSYHLQGVGCPSCGLEICKNSRRGNVEDFIRKSKKIHKNIYDYSKVKYVNISTKVKISCPIHGEFEQTPAAHYVLKQGCPKCGIEKQRQSSSFTLTDFIKKSKHIHGNLYDYSKVNYVNCHTDIIIICKEHGEFSQLPLNHLKRNGCPKCQSSYGENEILKFLKSNRIECITQKTFNACRNPKTNKMLPFDFYIPSKNLLIEYDGKHHFIIGRFGKHKSTINELKKTQYRDKLKTDFANLNGITLLRIKYTDLNHINEILKLTLNA